MISDHRLIRREPGGLAHPHSVRRNDAVSVRYTNTGTEGTGTGLSAKGDSDPPFCGVYRPRMFREVRSEELLQMDMLDLANESESLFWHILGGNTSHSQRKYGGP